MIDLALLRIIKYKEQYDKVARYIPKSSIDKRTRAIAEDIGKYYSDNPDEEVLDFPSFRSMFFTTWHRNLEKADVEYYNQVLTRMEDDVSASIQRTIINQLLELELATNVANIVNSYELEDEIDIVSALTNTLQACKDKIERSSEFEYAAFDDNSLEEEDSSGYQWHLACLNKSYLPIQGGRQTIIAARPGKGKTSFITHLNAIVAPQMPEGKIILWFNNESRRQIIMSRQIQSALAATDDELQRYKETGEYSATEALESSYIFS